MGGYPILSHPWFVKAEQEIGVNAWTFYLTDPETRMDYKIMVSDEIVREGREAVERYIELQLHMMGRKQKMMGLKAAPPSHPVDDWVDGWLRSH